MWVITNHNLLCSSTRCSVGQWNCEGLPALDILRIAFIYHSLNVSNNFLFFLSFFCSLEVSELLLHNFWKKNSHYLVHFCLFIPGISLKLWLTEDTHFKLLPLPYSMIVFCFVLERWESDTCESPITDMFCFLKTCEYISNCVVFSWFSSWFSSSSFFV